MGSTLLGTFLVAAAAVIFLQPMLLTAFVSLNIPAADLAEHKVEKRQIDFFPVPAKIIKDKLPINVTDVITGNGTVNRTAGIVKSKVPDDPTKRLPVDGSTVDKVPGGQVISGIPDTAKGIVPIKNGTLEKPGPGMVKDKVLSNNATKNLTKEVTDKIPDVGGTKPVVDKVNSTVSTIGGAPMSDIPGTVTGTVPIKNGTLGLDTPGTGIVTDITTNVTSNLPKNVTDKISDVGVGRSVVDKVKPTGDIAATAVGTLPIKNGTLGTPGTGVVTDKLLTSNVTTNLTTGVTDKLPDVGGAKSVVDKVNSTLPPTGGVPTSGLPATVVGAVPIKNGTLGTPGLGGVTDKLLSNNTTPNLTKDVTDKIPDVGGTKSLVDKVNVTLPILGGTGGKPDNDVPPGEN